MTEIDPAYRPLIEHSPRWFFVGRMAATGAIRATMTMETLDMRSGDTTGPSVIAPNHQTMIDPFTTAVAAHEHGFGQIAFLAKREIFEPLGSKLGPDATLGKRVLARTVDYVPNQVLQRIAGHPTDRNGEADKEEVNNWAAHELNRMGVSVEIFPEGTRNRDDPTKIGKLRDGASFAAIYANRPIYPMGNAGTRDMNYGPSMRQRNVSVNVLRDPLHPRDYILSKDMLDAEVVRRAAKDMTADLADLLQESFDIAADHRAFLLSRHGYSTES